MFTISLRALRERGANSRALISSESESGDVRFPMAIHVTGSTPDPSGNLDLAAALSNPLI